MSSTVRSRIFVVIVVIAGVNTAIAAWLGYLSPDSWQYLQLANAIKDLGAPVEDGSYFAVFPLGYPGALALISWGLTTNATIVLSKVLNLAFVLCGVVLLDYMGAPLLLAGLVGVSALALKLASFTWSENLMVVAFFISISSIYSLHHGGRNVQLLILFFALAVGFLARYFFGFLLVPIAVAYVFALRSELRVGVLVVMLIALLAFCLYLAINRHLAGFATGMPRIPAPETSIRLLSVYARASVNCFATIIISMLVSIWLFQFVPRLDRTTLFALLCGFAYLGLMAIIRFRLFFDLFDWRILGPGWLMVGAGLALACRAPTEPAAVALSVFAPRGLRQKLTALDQPARALAARVLPQSQPGILVLVGVLSLAPMNGENIAKAALNGDLFKSPFSSLADYKKNQLTYEKVDGVIRVFVPSPRVTIAPNDRLYYGLVPVLSPVGDIFEFVSSVEKFQQKHLNCQIDYVAISSAAQLSLILNPWVHDRRISLALRDLLASTFAPNALVSCSRIAGH